MYVFPRVGSHRSRAHPGGVAEAGVPARGQAPPGNLQVSAEQTRVPAAVSDQPPERSLALEKFARSLIRNKY